MPDFAPFGLFGLLGLSGLLGLFGQCKTLTGSLNRGHTEVAEKYFTETYMQHNPNVATGREALVEFFSKFMKPQPIIDTIKAPVVAILAEGNLVTLSFARTIPDPVDKTKIYMTTWFDMFRIENGKIAEHWDSAEKMKPN